MLPRLVILVALGAAAGFGEAVEVGDVLIVRIDRVERRARIIIPFFRGIGIRVGEQEREPILC